MIGSQPAAPDAAREAPLSATASRRLLRKMVRLRVVTGMAAALAVFACLGAFLTYQRFSTTRPLVFAGSEAITQRDYEQALEQKSGKEVLNELVSAALVRQAAARAGVLPTDDDVTARLALIRQRDPSQVQQAEDTGGLPALRDQISAQIALENLRLQNVSVSDADIARFYAAHQSNFEQPAQASMNLIVAQTAAQAEDGAADLRNDIPLDVIAQQTGLHVAGYNGYSVNLATPAGRALAQSWKTMRGGEIRTAPLGKQFLVAQMVSAHPARSIPLRSIKADVARLARLEKAPSAETEIARLYQATPPSFPVEKYAAFFDTGARR